MGPKTEIPKAVARLATELSRRIGDHKVIDDRDLLEGLAGDESHCEPRMPDLAVRADCTDDVRALLELADKFDVPVTPRGGGTGKSGGAIPFSGGVVLDMTGFNRIVEIDRHNLLAVVEPGIVTGVFQEAAEAEGLFYPPDPNSLETCTMGGNVAHNAGGPRAFKYGVTREYVLGTRTVLMGGKILKTGRRTVKGVAGYDVTALLVGSEGTMGVFTELTVKLMRKPPSLATLLVRLPDEIAGGRAVARIVEAGLVPRVLEFMDGMMVDVLRHTGAGGIEEGTGALLLAELDGADDERVEKDAERLAELCEKEGAVEVLMARHGGERDKLWAARRTLSDSIKERSAFKMSEDIVVPRAEAPRLLEGLRTIGKRYGVVVPSYGHAGDGNYHVNVLWDDPDFDPDAAVCDLFDLTLGLGGTITGEHGIGMAKRDWLPREIGVDTLAVMRDLKKVFDPRGLMNPGKIFV